jgi:hypothetical protein
MTEKSVSSQLSEKRKEGSRGEWHSGGITSGQRADFKSRSGYGTLTQNIGNH